MQQRRKGRAASARADRESQGEHAQRRDPQHPADHHQQGIADTIEKRHDRLALGCINPRQPKREQQREYHQLQHLPF